jgi:hypothetical protein
MMRKLLILVLPVFAVLYFFLAEVGEPVYVTTPIAITVQPGAGSSTKPAEPGDPDPSTPLRMPAISVPGNETLPPSDGHIGQPAASGHNVATTADPDAKTDALWRLADHNMAQLYAVLWQALELEEPDDADFYEFVLAILEELGDSAPGEILAALVQTAPTPALRLSALRLLAEASQELSIDPFNRALEDPDPAIRRSALDFFEELGANALLNAVADAVLDPNRAVRLIAFSTMEEMYKYTPVWEVADLVIHDPDPQIRMRALELLTYGGRQAATYQLVLALGDPNPRVSELAGALLSEFEQAPS